MHIYRTYTDIPDWLKGDMYDVYIKDLPTNFNPPTTGFVDSFDMVTLILPRSQAFTVMPFHFVPYNLHALTESDFKTREASIHDDSFISMCLREACSEYRMHTSGNDSIEAQMRVGVLLHIFADTCAHQGFSGILEDGNEVELKCMIDNRNGSDMTNECLSNITNTLSEADIINGILPPIGHALVDVAPDLTHVTWTMRYKYSGMEYT